MASAPHMLGLRKSQGSEGELRGRPEEDGDDAAAWAEEEDRTTYNLTYNHVIQYSIMI